ncbi:MAG: TatD family hydrolase [Thermoplasmatota archaeon]
MGIPIHDNHFHCRPDGWKGLGAVREFMAAGGTSIAHVRLPTYPTSSAAFTASCVDHIAFGAQIRTETGCRVWSAVGPYPLEILEVAKVSGWPAASAFGRACLDAAAKLCGEGAAHCIGEVGRPHFAVDEDAWAASNELLEYGMGAAKDAGVPIMLHTEHAEPLQMAEFSRMADRAGLRRDRVIKHYCGPLVTPEETSGLVPSIIAGRSNIRAALAKGDRFVLETDYIDEPSRPDVVMPCTTIPKRTLGLLQNGELTEGQAHRIHEEIPVGLYG